MSLLRIPLVALGGLLVSGLLLLPGSTASAANHVVAWGIYNSDATNVPPAATNIVAIGVGPYQSFAVQADGSLIAWGSAVSLPIPVSVTNVVSAAGGVGYSVVLRKDGTVIAWGNSPRYPGSILVPPGLSNVVAIACGDEHVLALRSNGTVVVWGGNSFGQTNLPDNLSNVVDIAAGYACSLAIRKDGTLWASQNLTNHIESVSHVVSVFGMSPTPFAIAADGSALSWNKSGPTNPLPGISNIVAITGSYGYSTPPQVPAAFLALRRDGTLVSWPGDAPVFGPTNFYQNLSNVLAVTSGFGHTLAVVGDSFGGPAEPPAGIHFTNGQFVLAQPTSKGRYYRLEYQDTLGNAWQSLPPAAGNGAMQTLMDTNPPPSQRFYHVFIGH